MVVGDYAIVVWIGILRGDIHFLFHCLPIVAMA